MKERGKFTCLLLLVLLGRVLEIVCKRADGGIRHDQRFARLRLE